MKKLVIGSILVGVFGIGCAVGTIAHNSMVPVSVAQTAPATGLGCTCSPGLRIPKNNVVTQCVCAGLNCLVSVTGASCVPNQ